jgi:hypothetical protein
MFDTSGAIPAEKNRIESVNSQAQRTPASSKKNGHTFSFWKAALFFCFGGVQLLLIIIGTDFLSANGSRLMFGRTNHAHIGDILFIGNMRGAVFECVDCTGKSEVLPELSSVLRAYKGSLVFDVGGFTAHDNYEASIAVYKKFYDRINVSGINLTKRDYFNIANFENLTDIPLISTNLKTDGLACSQYRSYTILPQGKIIRKMYRFNIVGLSDNVNYPYSRGDLVVESELVALNRAAQYLKGDIIVLYYNSEYCLESLLSKWTGPKIKLVIGCYAGTVYDTIKYIKNVPYTYIGDGGINVGHIGINQYGKRVVFSYDTIRYSSIFSEDIYIRNILELYQGARKAREVH